jgi:transposase
MNYTIKQFKAEFPTDDACLEYIFKNRYGMGYKCPVCGKGRFYRVKNRRCFNCACGYQVHPVSGTIFHKSETKLTDWFFAIYLMSNSKNGVSAKELQRHIGCTYKTAWRIAKQIRSLMGQDRDKLSGIVEADATYFGGKGHKRGHSGKTPVMGIVQRGGEVKAKQVEDESTRSLLTMLKSNVKLGSRVITDDASAYNPNKVLMMGMMHDRINHSKDEYVKGDIYTNTIEGFFSQLKRSIDGTYHQVSVKHLQSYVNEFAYHYNSKSFGTSVFQNLLSRLCGQLGLRGYKMSACRIPVIS